MDINEAAKREVARARARLAARLGVAYPEKEADVAILRSAGRLEMDDRRLMVSVSLKAA